MSKRDKPLRLYKKVLFSALVTAFFFGVLEAVLFLAGVSRRVDTSDPYVGFADAITLMMEVPTEQGRSRMVTRPGKLVWFNRQMFDREKPENTRRIFCLGGSTTFGRPFSEATAFSGWLKELLPRLDPTVEWEVINVGGISYASYRVAAVMEEMAEYDPDLFVVYTGQNEFLEDRTYADILRTPSAWVSLETALSRSRTFSLLQQVVPYRVFQPFGTQQTTQANELLPAEVDERLNHTIGPQDYERDDDWAERVVRHFEFNLKRMVKIAERADVPLVLIQPGSNELNCAPFKSVSLLSDDDQAKVDDWMRRLASGTLNLDTPDPVTGDLDRSDAIAELQRMHEADPRNADVNYLLGNLLFQDRQYERAKSFLRQALDQDVCPLRMTTPLRGVLANVGSQSADIYVNFEQLLREETYRELGHDILGDHCFLDHVHPSIDGHRILAVALIEALQASGWLSAKDSITPEILASASANVYEKVDQFAQGIALRNLAKVMHWSGKYELAAARATDALELLANDAESRFVLADCLKNLGQLEHAKDQYEYLIDDYPDYARAFLPFGEVLLESGEVERAEDFLLSALLYEPDNAYLHLTLGRLYQRQGQWNRAIECFSRSLEIRPKWEVAQASLDECYAAQDREDDSKPDTSARSAS